MTERNSMAKIITALFIALLLTGFLRSGGYAALCDLFTFLGQDKNAETPLSIDGIETDFTSSMWMEEKLIDLNGLMAKALGMQGLYADQSVYVTDENYIVSSSRETTTDYEYEETVGLRDFCAANGINLIYVNEPTKYVDDSLFSRQFGLETYTNRNADLFLNRIRAAGVETLDLRDYLAADGLRVEELFYRTDHHWTVPAGLWATRIIAQTLNEKCGYHIDLSIYDESNYEIREWKNCWLGEQGRKVAGTYTGLDDYTEIKPKFATSYTFTDDDGNPYEGTFDEFIDESVYNTENNVYDNPSWHYSYDRLDCINNQVAKGRVLMLADSYDHVTHPFLSLGVHEMNSMILRSRDDSFSLHDYILDHGFDTVIIAYAEFMIGAHDRESSANYRMFTFDH